MTPILALNENAPSANSLARAMAAANVKRRRKTGARPMDRSSPIKAAIPFVITLIVVLGLAGIANAQNRPPVRNETAVDLNLVLAVDASGSVDNSRFALQNRGYAAAFRNPRVLAAIRAGDQRAIAVSMVQWTGPTLHVVVVPWTLVNDQRSAVALATAIDGASRQIFGGG